MTDHNETLRYATGASALGTVLAAVGSRGVAAIMLGRDAATLARELAIAFPDARRVEDADAAGAALAAAIALAEAPGIRFPLPLDLRGSPLELAVWDALRAIPSGETRSYGAIAKALPVTATAQEVGAACAANRIALAVPCHRVVKADGSISGYRWGVGLKRRLIALEAAA